MRRTSPPSLPLLRSVLSTAVLFTSMLVNSALAAPQDTKEQSARLSPAQAGRLIYLSNCIGCHGMKAEGAIAPNIHKAGKVPLKDFKRMVLQGKGLDGRTLNPTMPRYVKGLRPHLGRAPTDTELKNLQAFLKTVK